MANPLKVIIKEDLPYLKSCLKKQPVHLKNSIQMLILLKKSEVPLSKMELAKQLELILTLLNDGANHVLTEALKSCLNSKG
jgi:hypothetical protein